MKTTITLAFLLLTSPVYAVPPTQGAPKAPVVVKLTASGLCHDSSSPYFKRINRYTNYPSLKACLAIEGTREPKNRKKAKTFFQKSCRLGHTYGDLLTSTSYGCAGSVRMLSGINLGIPSR